MKTTVTQPFIPLQLSALQTAVADRSFRLMRATASAAAGRTATTRPEDSAAALALDAFRYEVLAAKLLCSRPLTRDDLEHAVVAASIAHRAKARTLDRSGAAVLKGVVDTLTDLVADEALVHDEY